MHLASLVRRTLYHGGMVSNELLETVATLSVDERLELIAHIEHTLDEPEAVPPDAEQHALAVRRLAEMRADPTLGMSFDEHLEAARQLFA